MDFALLVVFRRGLVHFFLGGGPGASGAGGLELFLSRVLGVFGFHDRADVALEVLLQLELFRVQFREVEGLGLLGADTRDLPGLRLDRWGSTAIVAIVECLLEDGVEIRGERLFQADERSEAKRWRKATARMNRPFLLIFLLTNDDTHILGNITFSNRKQVFCCLTSPFFLRKWNKMLRPFFLHASL
jgi:hypothetical protein